MNQLVSQSEQNSEASNETSKLREETFDTVNVDVKIENIVERTNPDEQQEASCEDKLQNKEEIEIRNDTSDNAKEENVGSTKHVAGRKRDAPSKLHMTFKRARIDSQQVMSQTHYRIENGLRKVMPYDHKYNTFVKGV